MNSFVLHLMRHGAPVTPGLMHGHNDVAPCEEGMVRCREQAATVDFDRLICSDLARAAIPARAIAAIAGCPVETDPRWRELDFGAWSGLDPRNISADALSRFWADPDENPPPDGEHWAKIVARVGDAIDELPPLACLIVTHAGAMRAAMHRLCGFPLQQCWAIDLPYGALLSIRIWEGERRSGQIVALRP